MVYRLSGPATEDVDAIYLQGLANFGEAQADRYHSELDVMFALLADFPDMARERIEIDPPVRIHRYRSHVIVYLTNEAGLLVLRIRHGHEDWSTNPLG